jgi:Mg-chelatase subunit ChlD
MRDTLKRKLTQETMDQAIPKSSTVQIVDRAEAASAEKPSLLGRLSSALTGGVERTARIAVDKGGSDIALMGRAQTSGGYDPYFVRTEKEKIESKLVLNDVIDKLKLDEAWGGKDGKGEKLSRDETFKRLQDKIEVETNPNSGLLDIRAKGATPEEAAQIANTVAEVYRDTRLSQRAAMGKGGLRVLNERLAEQENQVASAKEELKKLQSVVAPDPTDPPPARKPAGPAPVPQPEVLARDNAFSTFSLNVSDVSFKLAAASLEQGQWPDPASVRSEEFINAFDYRDPEAPPGAPLAFAWERARAPFAHNRDLLRFSVKTAASGRPAGRPLNLVLVLDNSGSMERADRVRIVHEGLRALATLLQPADKLSVITFARTPRLRADGAPGSQAAAVMKQVGGLTPEGGTNLEEALRLAYATAARHYLAGGINHVVLLTDGAANLGDVDPASLQRTVEAHRRQGIALDCFGVGWEGFNDDLLEVLARHGDGRYGFLNSPAEAASGFAASLAGALRVAASDVKVQVEFNPRRVTAWRQIGYAKHQLTKEQFRDNTVDAAELAAQEAGNALYTVEVNPRGEGPLATVRARFKVPGTTEYREYAWEVPFTGNAVSAEQASPAMRLAATASAFSEWLASSPFAGEVTSDRLLELLRGVPETFGADVRARKLEEMIRQAKNLRGQE